MRPRVQPVEIVCDSLAVVQACWGRWPKCGNRDAMYNAVAVVIQFGIGNTLQTPMLFGLTLKFPNRFNFN